MRIPVWGVEAKKPYPIDEDYVFECNVVSIEELFAGKIKALLDRSAARDLYDVYKLSEAAVVYNAGKLRKALILFGLTCDDDWRKKDFRSIEVIDQRMIDQQLNPLRRSNEPVDLNAMKDATKAFLSPFIRYNESESRFMDRFLDKGLYEPELIFNDAGQAERLRKLPAVLWKLQNHRQYLGLDKLD
jgi:hypothetical protein